MRDAGEGLRHALDCIAALQAAIPAALITRPAEGPAGLAIQCCMRRIFLLAASLVALGCSSGRGGSSTYGTPAAGAGPGPALTLVGPGGAVSLGDPLETAKKAFPAPAGAQAFDSAMNFAIVTQTGWAWGSERPRAEGFEAATRDGKIIALARTGGDTAGEPAKMIAALGRPLRRAEGNTVEVLVWEAGSNARIWVHLKRPGAFIQVGSMLMIGAKSDLAMLNYRSEDPVTMVKQMEAAAAQTSSPEMRKIVEEAKARALAKKRAKGG